MAAANKGWAVGKEGVILAWNGSTWSKQASPTSNWFRVVATVPGTNPVQAWAPADKAGIGVLARYDGSSWKATSANFFSGVLYDVDILSTSDGWAVGGRFGGTNYDGQWLQWNGTKWEDRGKVDPELNSVDMLASNDGWAVGDDGCAYHYDGAAWSAVATDTTDDLCGLDMLTPTDGWAVGQFGRIVRWNGSAWSSVSSPISDWELRAVAMVSASDGWAVGEGGTILHWDGSTWAITAAPSTLRLESVSLTPGLSGSDAWAVGASRNLMHWNGHEWHPVTGPSLIASYYGVDMVHAWDGWASATGGRMVRWNGSEWVDAARTDSMVALAMAGSNDGWAVGWGKIVHWDGSTWTRVPWTGTRTFYGMDLLAANDIWAVGDGGTIAHCDGHNWSAVASPQNVWLTDVSMASPSEGYIVGSYGTIFKWNGSTWTKVANSPTSSLLNGVAVQRVAGKTVGWAVGIQGTALWLQNGAWSVACSPTSNMLDDVVMVTSYEAWAVGENGVILHWVDPARPGISRRAYVPLARKQ